MKEKIKAFFKDKYNIAFLVIIVIAILTRLLWLDKFPAGIHEDEAGMMYDAYCMAEYGTDRYLNHNPVYLINFGGGQSVLYAALASFFIRIFGFSLFVVRLPSFLFSILTIILAFLLAKKFLGKKFALLFAFLITICPWHIMQARWGLDCNLFPSFIMLSLYAVLSAKKDWHYILAGICFGLTLYTYALSYILIPVFFVALAVYLIWVKKATLKQIVIMLIPILILAFPLLWTQIINYLGKGTIDLGFITIPQLFQYRIGEVGFENVLYNLNITNYNNFFFLLFSAVNNPGFVLTEFGSIYFILVPFAIWGIILVARESIKSIKNKEFNLKTVIFLQFFTMSICILFFKNLQVHKLNALFIPLLFFCAEAISWIYKKKKFFAYMIILSVTITFVIFAQYYFKNINQKVGVEYNTDAIPLFHYLEENYPEKEIFLEIDAIAPYIYYLLATEMSPYEFMENMTMVQFMRRRCKRCPCGKLSFL